MTTLSHEQITKEFKAIQEKICARFEELDGHGKFEYTPWQKTPEDMLQGSGEMRLMRSEVFEKVGVNFSCVHGQFSEKFAKEIPGADKDPNFWACGVSLVAHMKNPHVPTVHMNIRRIETSKGWFGGGADLTPTIEYPEDTQSFHAHLQKACDDYRSGVYTEYKKWCDEYFYLPHRKEARGVGGIFYDYVESDDVEADYAFTKQVADEFLAAYTEIVTRRKDTPYTTEDKKKQKLKRGRYVEFNLLHDRGTRFGLMTGGNVDAILMSMPPEAAW